METAGKAVSYRSAELRWVRRARWEVLQNCFMATAA